MLSALSLSKIILASISLANLISLGPGAIKIWISSAILNYLVQREKFGPGSLSQRLASEVEDFTAKYSDIPF